MFAQPFVHAQITENIPGHWSLWGVTGEFPAQRASNAENVSIWWRHHGYIVSAILFPFYGVCLQLICFFNILYFIELCFIKWWNFERCMCNISAPKGRIKQEPGLILLRGFIPGGKPCNNRNNTIWNPSITITNIQNKTPVTNSSMNYSLWMCRWPGTQRVASASAHTRLLIPSWITHTGKHIFTSNVRRRPRVSRWPGA